MVGFMAVGTALTPAMRSLLTRSYQRHGVDVFTPVLVATLVLAQGGSLWSYLTAFALRWSGHGPISRATAI
jgi:hypothetical protein